MQVEAKPRKLRNLNRLLDEMDADQDMRYCFASIAPPSIYRSVKPDALAVWAVGDYARTTKAIGDLPRGTYVVVKEVVDRSYTTEELDPSLPVSGIRVTLEALDPKNPTQRIPIIRWDGIKGLDDIEKVEHDMTVIAIAATGL